MIREYGIDPEIFDSPESFYRITGFFGLEYFRLIRNFPTNWGTRVWKALKNNVAPKRKLMIVEDLKKLEKDLIKCSYELGAISFSYNEANDWFSNSQQYHSINAFDGIICGKNPNSEPHIYRSSDLGSSSTFFAPTTTICRTSIEMAKSVKTLFLYANEIHLIDPYFASSEMRFIRPLREMISFFELRSRMKIALPNRFRYHTSIGYKGDDYIQTVLNRELSNDLISSISLEIIRWPDEELHNRAIISNMGGVIFGVGLDDAEDYAVQKTDIIKPLNKQECIELSGHQVTSEKYMSTAKSPSIVITGRKRI